MEEELRKVSKIAEELYEKGRAEEAQEVALAMLVDGESIEKVMKYTKLTRQQIEELNQQRH